MGKGDQRTQKGKRTRGSYGNSRSKDGASRHPQQEGSKKTAKK